MRHAFAALAVVTFVALTATADDEKYTSKDGKFTVQFPEGAKVTDDTKKAGPAVDMKFAIVEVKGNGYIVMYMDLPEAVKNIPAKTILDSGEKGGAEKSGGKVVSSKDFEFSKDKLPGREFVIEKDGTKANNRIILAGTRLYVVTVSGPKDFATSKEAVAFLDSFQITK